jgi:hypothetical protein
MIRNTTFSALATIGVALFMMSAPAQTSQAFTCDDPLASKDQLDKCDDFENFLRANPKEDSFPTRTGEGEDPCFHLAIPYDLCLQTIGKEWWAKQQVLHKPRCSNNVKPGTVVLTDPPTYNCKDLNTPTAEQIRIQALEKRISELERHIHNLRRARIKSAGKCGLLDNYTDCEQIK